ncbi:hypothetical protein MAH1_31990 [Sessilibacter sp. MAH1]
MLHMFHRISACFICGFIVVHICNHLFALGGVDTHIAVMDVLRQVYRQQLVEIVLLGCVTFQVGSGLLFIKRRWGQRKGFFERLQAISGGYLAFFLVNHVGAVLFGRAQLDLDTNFYFAAAGIYVDPFQFYFIPYYFLAVVAVFCHVACAAHWLLQGRLSLQARDLAGYSIIFVGVLVSFLIMLAFSGGLFPVEIPSEYRATYGGA